MNWAVIKSPPYVHVVPMREEHDINTVCPCKPQLDIEQPNVVIHNSWDGREKIEMIN